MSNNSIKADDDEILFISKEAKDQIDISSLIPKPIFEDIEKNTNSNCIPIFIQFDFELMALEYYRIKLAKNNKIIEVTLFLEMTRPAFDRLMKQFTENESLIINKIYKKDKSDLIKETTYFVNGINAISFADDKTQVEVNFCGSI